MTLTEQEADLFFKLMWALHFFVKEKLGLIPEITDLKSYSKCSMEQKIQIRNIVFGADNAGLVDAFLQENPQRFSNSELALVAAWKHFLKKDFYIERFLKNYNVFIDDKENVYGVVGLYQSLDDIIPKSHLPSRVHAILLPFLGKIIYDGALPRYNVFFGKGISGDLKNIYLAAKKNASIVTDLLAQVPAVATPESHLAKTWEPELEQLIALAAKLRGGAGQPPISSPAFSLVKASLEFARLAVAVPVDAAKLEKCLDRIDRAFKQAEEEVYRLG
jgi:hypothetical protein